MKGGILLAVPSHILIAVHMTRRVKIIEREQCLNEMECRIEGGYHRPLDVSVLSKI